MRKLPSLNALRAFEAAARHESFTRAADELGVTQGAVSHQVKALETDLGVALFRRSAQRLHLTEAGQRYAEGLQDAFDRIAFATQQLLRRPRASVLTVTTSPNFATKWLVPRIRYFAEAHPEIDLRVSASLQHIDFAVEDVDVAIRHGEGEWQDLHQELLFSEELFPVCSPRLREGRHALRIPADLAHHTLLHIDDRDTWRQWLATAGLDIPVGRGPIFNQASLAIDAAADGQGVALARTALSAGDIIAGRLVRPFDLSLPVDYGYWIVCPPALAEMPKVAIFRQWLQQQAAADLAALARAAT